MHGIVTLGEDGKIEYIHDDTETLLDSMTYILKDSTCTDTATVYIIINPVADCPIPVDDVYYVTEGDTLTVDSCVTAAVNKGSNNEKPTVGKFFLNTGKIWLIFFNELTTCILVILLSCFAS